MRTVLRDRRRSDEGFTLIELLVVVVILGILIGIAIPVYLNYRKSANDKAAQSDLRGAVSTLEACNSETGYPTSIDFTAATVAPCTGQTLTKSDNVTYVYYGTATAYIMSASAGTAGSSKIYCYSSTAGGSVKTTATALTAYRALCGA